MSSDLPFFGKGRFSHKVSRRQAHIFHKDLLNYSTHRELKRTMLGESTVVTRALASGRRQTILYSTGLN